VVSKVRGWQLISFVVCLVLSAMACAASLALRGEFFDHCFFVI